MNEFVISLGSNIDADKNIQKALIALQELGEVKCVSDILITKPIGIINQADFNNGAILFYADYTLNNLIIDLKNIENQLGRDRSRPKFGPREIDLDVVVFNNQIVDADYHSREFLRNVVHQVWTKK